MPIANYRCPTFSLSLVSLWAYVLEMYSLLPCMPRLAQPSTPSKMLQEKLHPKLLSTN